MYVVKTLARDMS